VFKLEKAKYYPLIIPPPPPTGHNDEPPRDQTSTFQHCAAASQQITRCIPRATSTRRGGRDAGRYGIVFKLHRTRRREHDETPNSWSLGNCKGLTMRALTFSCSPSECIWGSSSPPPHGFDSEYCHYVATKI
jgi:hypothetical protein